MTTNTTGTVTRGLLTAAVFGLAWLPAQKAEAINTTVGDALGARAMSNCMLDDGKMRTNGDQVVCCTPRFCVACKDDEDCRVWSNDKLNNRVSRPTRSGGTTNASEPDVAPSRKNRNQGAAPKAGAIE